MSTVSGIGGQGEVRAAIARAAQATGVDFDYLLAQAKLESSLDPQARARTSSAAGLYQFIGRTWLDTLDRHGAEHGLAWASEAIDRAGGGAAVADPALRAQVLALRFDPQASALMAAKLASDNRAHLAARLGREPDSGELYLAHFLGADGAGRFLEALAAAPGQTAAAILPEAASANRAVFYDRGAPRSLGAVMDLLRGRLAGAMEGQAAPAWADTKSGAATPPPAGAVPPGPVAREFQARAAAQPALPATRVSIAETLRETFALRGGLGGGTRGAVPASAHAAYARFRALGL